MSSRDRDHLDEVPPLVDRPDDRSESESENYEQLRLGQYPREVPVTMHQRLGHGSRFGSPFVVATRRRRENLWEYRERDEPYLPARHPLHVLHPPPSVIIGSRRSGGGSLETRRTPLLSSFSSSLSSTALLSRPRNPMREIAVMELDSGVVVFPGDSLPLRIRGPWLRHLSEQVERARLYPSQHDAVQFGVVAKSSRGRPTASEAQAGPSRLSWTRQAWGPRRLSRFSDRVVRELQRAADEDDDDANSQRSSSSNNNNTASSSAGARSLNSSDVSQLRRRGVVNASAAAGVSQPGERPARGEAAVDSTHPALVGGGGNGGPARPPQAYLRRWNAIPSGDVVRVTMRGGEELSRASPYTIGGVDDLEAIRNPPAVVDLGGTVVGAAAEAALAATAAVAPAASGNRLDPSNNPYAMAEFLREHERGSSSESDDDDDLSSHPSVPGFQPASPFVLAGWMDRFYGAPIGLGEPHRQPDDEAVVGRTGTIVTVMYTHGDAISQPDQSPLASSSVWGQHGEELVVTAMGTSRFRIVHAFPSERNEVKRYAVEEITEDEMVRPTPASRLFGRFDDVIGGLDRTTPLPAFVWRRAWPEHLASQIRGAMERSSLLQSLARSMNEEYRQPLQLSYWLASNMALQQHEKLQLLEMVSPVERLQWILRKLLETERADTVIQCKRCGCPLTRGSRAFTVSGSQGTTGNYVNEHGHVHQTMTFRTVDDDEVSLSGRAETHNSWFPGYSWTIMSCGFCLAHLGWKFQRVEEGAPATEDRPLSFYGLSTSQVTTVVPELARARARRGPFRH